MNIQWAFSDALNKSKTEKQLSGTKEEKRETWNDGRRINPCNAVLKKKKMHRKRDGTIDAGTHACKKSSDCWITE